MEFAVYKFVWGFLRDQLRHGRVRMQAIRKIKVYKMMMLLYTACSLAMPLVVLNLVLLLLNIPLMLAKLNLLNQLVMLNILLMFNLNMFNLMAEFNPNNLLIQMAVINPNIFLKAVAVEFLLEVLVLRMMVPI
jgi:hypothetical protein